MSDVGEWVRIFVGPAKEFIRVLISPYFIGSVLDIRWGSCGDRLFSHIVCVWEGVFVDVMCNGFDSLEEVIHGGSEESKGAYSEGRSCAFESKSWPMISSPERVMPDCLQVTALFRLLPR